MADSWGGWLCAGTLSKGARDHYQQLIARMEGLKQQRLPIMRRWDAQQPTEARPEWAYVGIEQSIQHVLDHVGRDGPYDGIMCAPLAVQSTCEAAHPMPPAHSHVRLVSSGQHCWRVSCAPGGAGMTCSLEGEQLLTQVLSAQGLQPGHHPGHHPAGQAAAARAPGTPHRLPPRRVDTASGTRHVRAAVASSCAITMWGHDRPGPRILASVARCRARHPQMRFGSGVQGDAALQGLGRFAVLISGVAPRTGLREGMPALPEPSVHLIGGADPVKRVRPGAWAVQAARCHQRCLRSGALSSLVQTTLDRC